MSNAGGAVVAAMAMKAEREVVRRLMEKGAVDRTRAIPLTPDSRMQRSALDRLVRGGAVRRNGDLHWFDAEGAQRFHDFRRRRIAVLLGVLTVILAILVVFVARG